MKTLFQQIRSSAQRPHELEQLYRSQKDKKPFADAIREIHQTQPENVLISAWNERLLPNKKVSRSLDRSLLKDVFFISIIILVAGLFFRYFLIHAENTGNSETLQRNIGFAFFPAVTVIVMMYRHTTRRIIISIAGTIIALLAYINILPWNEPAHTTLLAIIHAQFILWSLIGIAFLNRKPFSSLLRMEFLQRNGESLIMMAILQICGMIFSGLTIALFSSTGNDIATFYFENIIPFGGVAVAVVGAYLALYYPSVSRKIISMIANIFAPMILVLVVLFLVSMFVTGESPAGDRDVLINYNALLIAVLAIIVFSVAQRGTSVNKRIHDYVMLALISVVSVANIIALYAIFYRLALYGITPNRAAVLGINVLVFTNLIAVGTQYVELLFGKAKGKFTITKIMSSFLTIYICWAIIVVLLFPVLFRFQ